MEQASRGFAITLATTISVSSTPLTLSLTAL